MIASFLLLRGQATQFDSAFSCLEMAKDENFKSLSLPSLETHPLLTGGIIPTSSPALITISKPLPTSSPSPCSPSPSSINSSGSKSTYSKFTVMAELERILSRKPGNRFSRYRSTERNVWGGWAGRVMLSRLEAYEDALAKSRTVNFPPPEDFDEVWFGWEVVEDDIMSTRPYVVGKENAHEENSSSILNERTWIGTGGDEFA
jgi:hypothetical protein